MKRKIKIIIDNLITIAIAFVVGLVVSRLIISNAVVPTGSMEATVDEKAMIIVNRTAYWFGEPQRGDIVAFPAPDDKETLYLKRIIGTPGDKVEIKGHQLYINDIAYKEDYITIKYPESDINYGPYTVPDGYYFMLGDNRDESYDSRFWDHKYVPLDDIIGKVHFQYIPEFRWFEKVEYIELN